MSRILVFGAGAIGQWIAGRVSLAGADVTVLCRRQAAAAIRERGVFIQQPVALRRLEAGNVRAVESLAEAAGAPPFDWIFLTVKTFDVAAALAELQQAGLLAPPSRVMGFQNGVGTEDLVAEALGPDRTFVCVVTKPIGVSESPGEVVEAAPRGGIAVAPYRPGQPLAGLETALLRTGMSVLRCADYRPMKWSKLLLNMTANAVCAILDVTPGELYADRRLYRVEHAAFREALAVMRALGVAPIDFPDYPACRLAFLMERIPRFVSRRILQRRVAAGRGSKLPSLRLEMDRERPVSEVGWLNGAVAAHGEKHGVPTPANAFITGTLEAIVRGEIPWRRYRGQRETFLADVTRGEAPRSDPAATP